MKIKRVSLIGLGALGIMFGNALSKNMERGDFNVVADRDRIDRYLDQGIYCNGERCRFEYLAPGEACEPADLAIFAVKYNGLKDSIKSMGSQVSGETLILSLLNGISSETILEESFGHEKVIYCVAQGMDAVKEGNKVFYKNMGMLVIGEKTGKRSKRVVELAEFLNRHGIQCIVEEDMNKKLWSKFMLNVGVNQVLAIDGGTYGEVQKDGTSRTLMKEAMREVIRISQCEGVNLTEEDIEYWMRVLASLSPDGKPSMRQDVEAKRPSELELFAGTVLEFGNKNGIATPVNRMIYDRIRAMEETYLEPAGE